MNLLERDPEQKPLQDPTPQDHSNQKDLEEKINSLLNKIQKQKDYNQQQETLIADLKDQIAKQKEHIDQYKDQLNRSNNTDKKRIGKRNTIILLLSIYIIFMTVSMMITYREVFQAVPDFYMEYWDWLCNFTDKMTLLIKDRAESFYFYIISIPLLIFVILYFSIGSIKRIIAKYQEIISYYKTSGQMAYKIGMTISLCSGSFLLAVITFSFIPDLISVIGWWLAYSVTLNILYHYLSYLR